MSQLPSRGKLVCRVEKDPQHVDADEQDHRRCAKVVQPADEASQCCVATYVFKALIGAICRWIVDGGERHAGDDLKQEGKKRRGAEDIGPFALFGNTVFQDRLEILDQTEPVVHRMPDGQQQLDQASTSFLCGQISATIGSLRHST